MNRKSFFEVVKELRHNILYNYWTPANKTLDKLVKIVMGEKTMTHELSLQEDVARIIKRIKEAKEDEALKSKANDVIEQLKKEL